MKRKIIGLICLLALLCTALAWAIPSFALEANNIIVPESDLPLRLWYKSEAPKINEFAGGYRDYDVPGGEDDGWQMWSLPLGNGYFGANVFGRTETERIQISEKTLANKYMDIDGVSYGGMNNFSETFIDFGHATAGVTNYERDLDLKTAVSGVRYTYGGVNYSREYFTSYPDKALVIKLDADTAGALSFTLRPTVPYIQSYMAKPGDKMGKTGSVTSSVSGGVGTIELSGKLEFYDVDFLGIYKVYTDGGTVTASTVEHTYEDTDGTEKTVDNGTISVNGAKSAYIVVTLGTDYELSSKVFTEDDKNKPTFDTDLEDTRAKVGAEMSAIDNKIAGKSFAEAYNTLKNAHVADYSELFSRVSIDLGCNSDDFAIPTDELLEDYKDGYKSTYLEALMFQYGRYTLIASSREGALPAHLQGAWNPYNTAPWGSGYWNNLNVQMNYWPAFSTNLAETFKAYVDYNNAFLAQAQNQADKYIQQDNPDAYGKDGGNGWVIGISTFPYRISIDASAAHLGFTTQMYWDYYNYTRDPAILDQVYKILIGAARYITKCVELDATGDYLIQNCDSPEVHVNGIWYYTNGTTYAQTFAYLNNYHALEIAKELGINFNDDSHPDYAIINTVLEQLDKYDPIHVGLSGQIKEFREEDFYSSVGDDPNHRHLSQLVGLYPGNIINSSTLAWLDAAAVTLDGRSLSNSVGWAYAHKMALYARVKDGEEARARIDELLSNDTFPNLYTRLWGIYQTDATYGTSAGISEMLLQSHSGYIEPLAALPEAWSTGSYTGLVAIGNFEVSAAWESGLAKTFNIKSGSGGTASVYYPSITGARVVDSKGNTVSYTVSGKDLISFETEVGEVYTIYGFKKIAIPDAPANLTATKNIDGTVKLSWSASAGATGYNVYVAVENAPTYTLVGTVRENSFVYTPAEGEKDLRTTYAVTAVSEDESKRALTYTYSDAVIETPYGTVTQERVADQDFIMFAKAVGESEYQFLGTGNNLVVEGLDKARLNLKPGADYYQGGTIVLYLLRDVTANGTASGAGWNAAMQMDGTIIVDLGGHKLTQTAMRLMGFEVKSGLDGYDAVTNVEIKNGIICTSKPIVEVLGTGTGVYTGTKVVNIELDNVMLKPNGSAFNVFQARQSGYNSTQKAEFNVTLNNCTLDYAGLSGMVVMNDICEAGAVKCNLNINGGYITANQSDITLSAGSGFGSEDSAKSSASFGEVIITPYGTVEKSKAEGGKFILFAKANGADAYTILEKGTNFTEEALNRARYLLRFDGTGGYKGGTVAIYLLENCDATSTSSGSGWNAAMQVDGTVIVDLGGKTLTAVGPRLMGFEAKSDLDGFGATTNVEFKNGTLCTSKPIVEVFANTGDIYEDTKTVNITFNNVTFKPNGTSFTLFAARGSYNAKQKAYFNVALNDCVLNYAGLSNMVLMDDSCESGAISSNLSINGGTITAKSFTDFLITKGFEKEDSVIFKMGANGKRTEFILPYTPTAPTLAFNTDDGIKHLASLGIDNAVAESERTTTYRLSGLKTPYGYIPEHQKDTAFSLFYNNLHITSHNNYSQAELKIKELLYPSDYGIYVGETLTLYMKKDYTHTHTPYGNFAQQDGTYVLDLGGNTLTMTAGGLFDVVGKAVNGSLYTTYVEVKNGTILTGESPLMILNSIGTSGNFGYNGTKQFSFIYENVTFDKSPSVSRYEPLMNVSRFDETTSKNMFILAIFNNCAFTSSHATLFDLSVSNYIDADIQINGGSITTEIIGSPAILKASDKDDKLTFGKLTGGNYTSFILPYGTEAPDLTFNGGSLHFIKISETESIVTFGLGEKAFAGFDFVPKSSISLHTDFVYNFYIPVSSVLKSVTFNGEELNLDNLNCVELDDGKKYYKLTVNLNSYEALRDVRAIAILDDGENSYSVSFNFGLLQYAKVLIDGDYSNVEKTIAKDMLSYVRAAYLYWNKQSDKLAIIDTILGEGYDDSSTPDMSKEGKTPVASKFTKATFHLGEAPSYHFYYDGDAAPAYTFKVGDREVFALTGTDTVGSYVKIKVYAHELPLGITFTDGTSTFEYNIYSYYAQAKDEVKPIVERLVKYCESAMDYNNNSFFVQINYVDESGKTLAPSYSHRHTAGEEINLLSPTVAGCYTRDVYFTKTVTENLTYNVVYKKIPTNLDSDKVAEILANLVCWGDSITAGACKNEVAFANQYGIDLAALGSAPEGASYVTVLRNLISSNIYSKISVRGCGVGGEATSTIAARADTETYYLYLDGEVTISNGAVTIPLTHYSSVGRTGILRQGGSSEINPVTICGKDINGNDISVTGAISISLTSDAPAGTDIRTCDAKYLKYTFTRDDGKTDTLSFASGARVITMASRIYDGRTCIIFMGENGGYKDIGELIKQQEEILKACGNPEFYLIISTTSGSYESRTEIREALRARWGERYINMGDEINSRAAYEFVGYPESAIESVASNIAAGTVSTLLIKDSCHPNAVGYAFIGNLIFERLYKLGAFDDIFDYYDSLNDLSGKTVTFLGDSITAGYGLSSTTDRYSSVVASSLGMTENNMGISSTVICTGGHRQSRLDDVKNISLESDYVGILLGINDFDQCRNTDTEKYYSLGEFGSTDTTTVYGALNKLCSDLVTRFGSTDTKVFLMTPVITSWNNSVSGVRDWDQSKKNACGYTLRDLCDAIEKVANHYGIETLDLNELCEMSESDFSDGIHPNAGGARKMADVIIDFLLANH